MTKLCVCILLTSTVYMREEALEKHYFHDIQ